MECTLKKDLTEFAEVLRNYCQELYSETEPHYDSIQDIAVRVEEPNVMKSEIKATMAI